MSSKALHVDGLWLCLRPAFSHAAATRSTSVLPRQKWVKTTARSMSTSSPCAAFSELHSVSDTSIPSTPSTPSTPSDGASKVIRHRPGMTEREHAIHHRKMIQKQKQDRIEAMSHQWSSPRDWQLQRRIPIDWDRRSDSNLGTLLETVVKEFPNYATAVRLAKELFEVRGVKPTTRHYASMIYANSEAEKGNPYQVRRLLEDMEENDIMADSRTFHAALRALAVHPDYLLRHEVLQTMRERWISLSPSGWHDVVSGYIRERQYEMALNTLSHMEAQQVPVQDWLYGLLIYNLCDAEEFDEALRLMKARLASGHNLSPNLWFRVLDLASEALHEEMVSFIWHRRVETGYINPSFGVCNNILTITSRTGNIKLAMSVFKVLEERNATFTQNDYEALIDTYAVAGDLESALRVLSSVKNISAGVEMTSTRSILAGLLASKPAALDVWDLMKRLHEEENVEIPNAAVNTLLEYCVPSKDHDAAVQIYKELHLVSSGRPTTITFNQLLHLARVSKRFDTAKFFIDEMHRSGVLPDSMTYQTLVLLFAQEGHFIEARNYYLEMTQSGFKITDVGHSILEKFCTQSENIDAHRFLRVVAARRVLSREEIGKIAKATRAADRLAYGQGKRK